MEKAKRVGWATAPRLQQWRERYGWSQAELARRSGVSRATISSAEQGRRINLRNAEAIAAAFGVARDKLAQSPDQEDDPTKHHFELAIFSTMAPLSSMKSTVLRQPGA